MSVGDMGAAVVGRLYHSLAGLSFLKDFEILAFEDMSAK